MRAIISLFLFSCYACCIQAQPVNRITYAVKETDTLWFDQYLPAGKANGSTVLFLHGGSFTGGDPVNQKPMADGLTKLGYQVLVIKYRLYLKGKSFGCETATPEKLKAIRLAVEDAADATNYIVEHAGALKIDTTRLFIAGSSAGAEAILNLVFNPFVRKGDKLYKPFPYAGVMSFAGAILDINTIMARPPLPVLLMHGTSDQLVPYATAAHRFCKAVDAGWIMMFGAHTLYEKMRKRKMPVILYTYEGQGHEVSNYMFRKFREMDDFMKNAVKHTVTAKHIVINKEQ